MFSLLYKYLMQHEQVCIAGVGVFLKNIQPANLNFSNKVFQPPVHTITFKEEQVKADKQFYAYISKQQDINMVDAIRLYQDFSFHLKNHLQTHRRAELPGLGVLKKDTEGHLIFEGDPLLADLFPATPAERIVREKSEHLLLVGDSETTNMVMQEKLDEEEPESARSYWWILVIILAVIAVAAIIYYYLQYNDVRL